MGLASFIGRPVRSKEVFVKGSAFWGMVAAGGILIGACQSQESDSQVERRIDEVRAARENAPQEAQRLEQELEEAKARVAELERQLALARQGITDEVVEAEQKLQESVQRREQNLLEESQQLQQEAREHNEATEAAQRELERTPRIDRVETDVETDTRVVPSEQQGVPRERRQTEIPVEGTRVAPRSGGSQQPQPQQPAPEAPVQQER